MCVIWNEGGKGVSVSDCARHHLDVDVQDYAKQNEISTEEILEAMKSDDTSLYPKRHGSDGYHHYKEDIKLFAWKITSGKFLPSKRSITSPPVV